MAQRIMVRARRPLDGRLAFEEEISFASISEATEIASIKHLAIALGDLPADLAEECSWSREIEPLSA